jgi:hypothetical protein
LEKDKEPRNMDGSDREGVDNSQWQYLKDQQDHLADRQDVAVTVIIILLAAVIYLLWKTQAGTS